MRATNEEVVELLGKSVETIQGLRYRNDFMPDAGRALDEMREFPVFAAYRAAARQLGASEDHARGLQTLLSEGETGLAPYALARASVEASGRAYILLDPDLSARERLALSVAERENDLRELGRLMKAHDPLGESEAVQSDMASVREQLEGLRAAALKDGISIPKRPRFSEVLRRVLAFSQSDDSFGRFVGTAYSAIAHATPEMLLALTVGPGYPKGHDFMVGFIELEDRAATELTLAVLFAYLRASSLQAEAYGWPMSSIRRWRGHVRAVFRRALAEEEAAASQGVVG